MFISIARRLSKPDFEKEQVHNERMNARGSAHEILEVIGVFAVPIGYGAYRLLLLPRLFEHSTDAPLSVLADRSPEQSDDVRAGNLVFSVIAIICTFFFLNIAGRDILVVMWARPLWGTLIAFLFLAFLTMVGMVEFIRRKNDRYTDLRSDMDEDLAKQEALHNQRLLNRVRSLAGLWFVLFVIAILWLWLGA